MDRFSLEERDVLQGLAGVFTPRDYAERAMEFYDSRVAAYLMSGAGEEITMRANEEAIAAMKLVPRVLVDAQNASIACELWGHRYDTPFFVAPMAAQTLYHPEGESAMMRGAAACDVSMIISMQASQPTLEIARHASVAPWLQVQLQRDGVGYDEIIEHAVSAGCRVLMVTVDAPVHCFRYQLARSGFVMPPSLYRGDLAPLLPQQSDDAEIFSGNMVLQSPRWHDIAFFCERCPLPVVLKGILQAEDACKARDHGARGVVVSNHGGRVLDGVPASLEMLPAVVAAVGGSMPVLFDSGIRSGVDVCKARMLGADAVLLGRPLMHALRVGGALGVAHCLQLFRRELEAAMVLTGRVSW